MDNLGQLAGSIVLIWLSTVVIWIMLTDAGATSPVRNITLFTVLCVVSLVVLSLVSIWS